MIRNTTDTNDVNSNSIMIIGVSLMIIGVSSMFITISDNHNNDNNNIIIIIIITTIIVSSSSIINCLLLLLVLLLLLLFLLLLLLLLLLLFSVRAPLVGKALQGSERLVFGLDVLSFSDTGLLVCTYEEVVTSPPLACLRHTTEQAAEGVDITYTHAYACVCACVYMCVYIYIYILVWILPRRTLSMWVLQKSNELYSLRS